MSCPQITHKIFKKHEKFNHSFSSYGNFWAGLIGLFYFFIEEGLDWKEVQEKLNQIDANVKDAENFLIQDGTMPPTGQLKLWQNYIK